MSGKEIKFDDNDIIVSKTDLRGIITYANHTFLDVVNYSAKEVIGKPHNITRHKRMPKCIFKLLWETISGGDEIFAYIVNRTKDENYYWVYAHVTPSINESGTIIGYHSSRRTTTSERIEFIGAIYDRLLDEEQAYNSPHEGMEKSTELLKEIMLDRGFSDYHEFVAHIATNL